MSERLLPDRKRGSTMLICLSVGHINLLTSCRVGRGNIGTPLTVSIPQKLPPPYSPHFFFVRIVFDHLHILEGRGGQ